MNVTPEEIEKMQKELDVLIKRCVMATAAVLEATDRNIGRMLAFETLELSHRANGDTSSPHSTFVATIATREGRDALDLWRMSERDLLGAKISSSLKWLEVDAYLTFMKLQVGSRLE